jgi:hypothetical protein
LDAAKAPAKARKGMVTIQNRMRKLRSPVIEFGAPFSAPARRLAAVQSFPKQLAGLEERHPLRGHVHGFAGPRVAAHAGIPFLDRKGAEPAQLDPVPARERRRDFIEDRRNDTLHVPVIKVRVLFREVQDQL